MSKLFFNKNIYCKVFKNCISVSRSVNNQNNNRFNFNAKPKNTVAIAAILALGVKYLFFEDVDSEFFYSKLLKDGYISRSVVVKQFAFFTLRNDNYNTDEAVKDFIENKFKIFYTYEPNKKKLQDGFESNNVKAHYFPTSAIYLFTTFCFFYILYLFIDKLMKFDYFNPGRLLNLKGSFSFNKIAGCESAKTEIMECVKMLKEPDKYTKVGAKIPKGVLLEGPPGNGKTLLAKAVASEADVPFYYVSSAEFLDKIVFNTESNIESVFSLANEYKPLVLFIDEIDGIGKKRTQQQYNFLNQLLMCMDGFDTNTGLLVIGATNIVDSLDPALLRPGRFDRIVKVPLPDAFGRKDIFKIHLEKITTDLDKDELAKKLAVYTAGFSGADIANVTNEAAILAQRYGDSYVHEKHFMDAVERIVSGNKKSTVLDQDERKILAYHEAGHVVAGWFLKHCDPVLKVSIVVHDTTLSNTTLLKSDRILLNNDYYFDMMCYRLGGLVSENIFFNNTASSECDNDIKWVTENAYTQILCLGFNKMIGHVSYELSNNFVWETKPYSDYTNELVDSEVTKLVDSVYNSTKELLISKKELVNNVAQKLLEKNMLDQNELESILGQKIK